MCIKIYIKFYLIFIKIFAGQHIDGQVRYPYLDNAVLRTHERTKQHMREAYLNDHEVFGMKGLSVFF